MNSVRIWNQVKLWSSQLWTQFLQLRKEAWKFQYFNGVWARDLGTGIARSRVQTPLKSWIFRKTLDGNDQNQVADQRFSLKQWFSGGAQSRGLRKPGCGHCYLRFFEFFRLLYAIAKIAFITARIMTSLEKCFVTQVQFWKIEHLLSLPFRGHMALAKWTKGAQGKTLIPVCPPKSSSVGWSIYLDGWTAGNTSRGNL